MQQALECGAGLAFPEPAGLDPASDRPVAAASPLARIIAVSGSSQPRMGDHRSPAGMPWRGVGVEHGDRAACAASARRVAVRLSGLVLVVTTAPGASRIALMTTCRPLPERGGPISRIESSTDAQTFVPRTGTER